MMRKKRFKQNIENIYLEKATNPLRKITWYHLIFAGWGGSAIFIMLHTMFKFNILDVG